MNITEQDVNKPYTCVYGFQKESLNFTVNETNFQLLPTNETTKISQIVQNGTLSIETQFRKILPKPICSGIINGISISLQEKSHPTRNGDFYNVTLYGAKPLVDANCYSVAVNCIIGTKTMTVYNKEQKDCTDDSGYDVKTIWIIVCVLGSGILMILVGIALYKNDHLGQNISKCCRRSRTGFFEMRRFPENHI
ncbi:Hypothetical predicted protein [Mytilus galloprovincialis]|nr:Hypothetical predicted protein [Mytilus galloprovincialis]